MVALSLEVLALMGAAYFIGAALACVIRRSLFAAKPAPVGERRVEPLPEVAAQTAAGARFARAVEQHRAAVAAAAPKAAAVPAAPPAAQDLQNIRDIDAATAASLGRLGVTGYDQIAAWMRADVERIEQALGQKGRISRENWIEQAQVLARGGETVYAARRAAGPASVAAPSPDAGVPATPGDPLPRPMSRVGVAAAVVAPPAAPKPAATPPASERATLADQAVAVRPSEPLRHDNLQRIGGITAEIEQKLGALGVSRYSEIAQWSPAAVERFDKELGTDGRISRENWIEQAQILSRGGDTRFSREFDQRPQGPTPPRPIKLPDAIRQHEATVAATKVRTPTRTDLGSLRSVRSEAYQETAEPGPEAARRVATRNKMVRAVAAANDLKRIRGIGVLTEKRLHAMGVLTYEDIANWTREDIDRVSKSLDFKGRIERENWVEQARILSSGGETEFSRRQDRREA
jgi:predicted flap endonuclease-1-like 5' DNA nuclease